MKRAIILLFLCVPMLNAAQENTAMTCADGLDNDNDGLIDCADPDCDALPNEGCQICSDDGLSFADVVISYDNPCPSTLNADPLSALGVSDFLDNTTLGEDSTYASLGEEGVLILGFTDNLLTNSGDDQPDLWIFEIGPNVEATFIELYPANTSVAVALIQQGVNDSDADGYYEFGTVEGALSSVDIDSYLDNSLPSGALTFTRVKLKDVPGASCAGNYPGADIDAVCALSSVAVPTGVEEYATLDLRIVPNPAQEQLYVHLAATEAARYSVWDASGRQVLSGSLHGPIEVAGLEAGMYALVVELRNGEMGYVSFVKE